MSVAVGDMVLSFLPSSCKTLAGTTVPLSATSMNPGFLTPTDVTLDPGLQAIVKRRILEDGVASPKHPELRGLRFALVDLTGADKLANPKFAGNKPTEQGGLGSLSKIACMWAAYQIKFDLEELARTKGLTTETDLFDAARNLWNDTQKRDTAHVQTLFPTNPKIELLGKRVEVDGKPLPIPRPFSAPDLEKLFDVNSGVITFKGSNLILVDTTTSPKPPDLSPGVKNYLAHTKENLKEVRKLTFAERLFLMIDESDGAAAHACIENVSFLYIHSSLWQADFYRPERGGGLWEGSTHDLPGFRWQKPPVPKGNPKADFVSANVASVAALLTLMEQGRLVNAAASASMKHQLDKNKNFPGGSNTRSFFLEAFDEQTIATDQFFSKLGIGDFLNDGAIILRTEGY